MLEADGLHAGYGSGEVLHGVSLEVGDGELVSLLGRNGAGKTTLLRTVMGFVRPSAGTVTFRGEDVTRRSPDAIGRLGIGYVPQEGSVFSRLTVDDNIKLACSVAGGKARPLDEIYELFPILRRRGGQLAGSLSGGERKFLAIARVLIPRPSLLVFDEPTEGVWPAVVTQIGEILAALRGSAAILLVEQNLDLALGIADRIAVMERGEIVLDGPTADVRDDPRLTRSLVA